MLFCSNKVSQIHKRPIMTEVTNPLSLEPQLPTVTPQHSFIATSKTLNFLTSTDALIPWEEVHMQVHTILIVIIFGVVCLLLLLAFFYTFCLHCSIISSPKASHMTKRGSLEREDATFRRSSSDNQSVGNVV